MRRLGTLLRGMGAACLLVAIVLCQTVLAHNEARTRERPAPQGPALHSSLRAGAGAEGLARPERIHLSRPADEFGGSAGRRHRHDFACAAWHHGRRREPHLRPRRHGPHACRAPTRSRCDTIASTRSAGCGPSCAGRSCRSTAASEPAAGGQCRPRSRRLDRRPRRARRQRLGGSRSRSIALQLDPDAPDRQHCHVVVGHGRDADLRPGSPRQLRSASHRGRRRAAERARFGDRHRVEHAARGQCGRRPDGRRRQHGHARRQRLERSPMATRSRISGASWPGPWAARPR